MWLRPGLVRLPANDSHEPTLFHDETAGDRIEISLQILLGVLMPAFAVKAFLTPDRTTKIIIFGIGLGLLLIALLRSHRQSRPNVCPIDGRAAEWTKPRDGVTCEYGHFSEMERTAHTWSARCP